MTDSAIGSLQFSQSCPPCSRHLNLDTYILNRQTQSSASTQELRVTRACIVCLKCHHLAPTCSDVERSPFEPEELCKPHAASTMRNSTEPRPLPPNCVHSDMSNIISMPRGRPIRVLSTANTVSTASPALTLDPVIVTYVLRALYIRTCAKSLSVKRSRPEVSSSGVQAALPWCNAQADTLNPLYADHFIAATIPFTKSGSRSVTHAELRAAEGADIGAEARLKHE